MNTGSSLNGISNVGEALISNEGATSENDVEIRQIYEESLQETPSDVAAAAGGTNTQKRRLTDKRKERIKTGIRNNSGSAVNVSSNTGSLNHDAGELNEEDWGADYDLPL